MAEQNQKKKPEMWALLRPEADDGDAEQHEDKQEQEEQGNKEPQQDEEPQQG